MNGSSGGDNNLRNRNCGKTPTRSHDFEAWNNIANLSVSCSALVFTPTYLSMESKLKLPYLGFPSFRAGMENLGNIQGVS